MCEEAERFELLQAAQNISVDAKAKAEMVREKLAARQSCNLTDECKFKSSPLVTHTALTKSLSPDVNVNSKSPEQTQKLVQLEKKKPPDERLETFWHKVADMSTFYFGTALWCVGWNVIATYLTYKQNFSYLPYMILGVMFIFSGFHCKFIHNRKKFKYVAYLIIFCAAYVFISILIIHTLSTPLIANFPTFPDFSIKKSPENLMNVGNIFLMSFTIYCNCTLIKIIGEQVGNEIDLFKDQITEIKNQKPIVLPERFIKRQTSTTNLYQRNSSNATLDNEQ